MIYLNIFILGLAFGSTACIASCGPLILSYNLGTQKNVAASIMSYILFSSARIIAYILLSICIYFLGNIIIKEAQPVFFRYIYLVGGFFIILVGLLFIFGKNEKIPLCSFLQKKLFSKDRINLFVFGGIMGLLPCAPLLALFSYVGLISKSWLGCLILTFLFGLGTFFSPLFLLVILGGLLPDHLLKMKPVFESALRCVAGIILLIIGLQLTGRFFNV